MPTKLPFVAIFFSAFEFIRLESARACVCVFDWECMCMYSRCIRIPTYSTSLVRKRNVYNNDSIVIIMIIIVVVVII